MVNEKLKTHIACFHLSADDNELIFKLVNEKSFSLCTVIVELYQTAAPAHSMWKKNNVGALCFEKDYEKKSYYFRLYCLKQQKLVWEQEIYRHMSLVLGQPFLITFEGTVGSQTTYENLKAYSLMMSCIFKFIILEWNGGIKFRL